MTLLLLMKLFQKEGNEWIIAMKDELKSIQRNEEQELVDLPEELKPISFKWAFNTRKVLKAKQSFKARLVIRGFHTVQDIGL